MSRFVRSKELSYNDKKGILLIKRCSLLVFFLVVTKYLHNLLQGKFKPCYLEQGSTQCGNYYGAKRKLVNQFNNINHEIRLH